MLSSDSEAAACLALKHYQILDTPREEEFDSLVDLVAKIFSAPIAILSFLEEDRQWFKAAVGLDVESTEIGLSICWHAVRSEGPVFVIRDTLLDEKTAGNPLVTGDPWVRFYAGAILTSWDGYPIGALCIMDHVPRDLDEYQVELLATMGRQVMLMLESRLRSEDRRAENVALRDEAEVHRDELKEAVDAGAEMKLEIAGRKEVLAVVTHDLRSPMSAITLVGHLLGEVAEREDSADSRKLAYILQHAAEDVNRLVSDLSDFSVLEQGQLRMKFERFELATLAKVLDLQFGLLAENAGIKLRIEQGKDLPEMIVGDPYRLRQALANVVGNALKFTPADGTITVLLEGRGDHVVIEITNSGEGIEPELLPKIFGHFWTTAQDSNKGRGIGLSIARAVARAHGGDICVTSEVGGLTTFTVTIRKG